MNGTSVHHPHAFNYQLQRLMIGLVALSLPLIVMITGCRDLTSISASYHTMSRDVFVACLSAVGLLMIPYQGRSGDSKQEFWVSKAGGVAAVIVAFMPTSCPVVDGSEFSCFINTACPSPMSGIIHLLAAVVVFASLFRLCMIFRDRALEKNSDSSRARAKIYQGCMVAIIAGALVIALDVAVSGLAGGTIVFWGEAIMLFAFSVAWLTASQIIFFWEGKRPALLPQDSDTAKAGSVPAQG